MDIDGATLSLKITQDGVAEAERGFARVGTAGEAAAAKVGQAIRQQASTAQQFTVTASQSAAAWKVADGSVAEFNIEIQRMRREWEATNAVAQQSVVATTQVAVAHEAAATAAGAHGLQLGRLRQELGTLVGRITGTSTALDRMGGALGAMAVGNGLVIGALAGIAAIGYAWEHMKSDAEKTADAVRKAMKDVHDEILKAQLGMGDLQQAAAKAAVDKAQKAFDAASKANSGTGGFISGGSGAKDAKKALDEAQAELLHWELNKTQIDTQIRVESERDYALQLALLISSNHATADERARALALYRANEAEIDRLGKTQTDNTRRTQLIGNDATLADALFPKQKVQIEALVLSHDALSTALDKQLDEMRKVNAEDNIAFAKQRELTAAIGVEGVAREILAAQAEAEIQRMEARGELAGVALADRLSDIDALERQTEANIRHNAALKDAEDRQKSLNDSGKESAKIAALHTAAIKADAAASVEQAAAFEKIKDAVGNDLLRGLDQFASKGITSFRDFFQEVAAMATRMVEQINKALVDTTKLSAGQIGQLKVFQGAAGVAGIAASGGLEGYQVGSQTTNLGRGALGGSATGAATGAAIGSVVPVIGTAIGAVIGGLAGAAGGLIGAADAHRKAAVALEKAAESVKLSLLQMNAQAGTGTALDSNIAQAKAQADALFNAIDAALPGLKNQTEREKEMAQVRKDEAIITQQLIDADTKAREQATAELHVRLLRAQGDTAAADAAAQANANWNELTDAVTKFGAASTQVADLLVVQAAEASRRAAELKQQTQDDITNLQLRMLTAAGLGNSGQALALSQKMEMDNAVLKYGLDSIQVQLLKVAQADELLAKQQQDAIDALNQQINLAQSQLQTAQAQLQAQQQAVNATKQVVDALKSFGDSLLTGPLSALSPVDQLNAAKAQRDSLFAAAQGGDATAASKYSNAAQTYLQLAQGYYASSPGYASAFSDTQHQTTQLSDQFGQQLDVQTQILNTLQSSNDKLAAQIAILQSQLDVAKGTRVDSLIAQINSSVDGNEISRLIGQVSALGYQVGRDTTTLPNGNLNPTGKYFAVGGGDSGIYTPPTGPIDHGLTNPGDAFSASPNAASSNSASSTSLADLVAEVRGLRADVQSNSALTAEGALRTVARIDDVVSAMEDNTTQTRLGLQAVQVAVR